MDILSLRNFYIFFDYCFFFNLGWRLDDLMDEDEMQGCIFTFKIYRNFIISYT